MIEVRKSDERGHFDHGWLDTYHSFSFASYRDPRHMGFRSLRVINEDRVQGGQGFGMHPHQDMEIVTYIIEGALEHRDSMGNGSVIRPGVIQRMTAGKGVLHSEFNASETDPVHLLQIWILPDTPSLEPGYEEMPLDDTRPWLALASEPGGGGAVTIHQDAVILRLLLYAGEETVRDLAPGRFAWLQVARGRLTVNETAMAAGDGAAISGESVLRISASASAEALLFDLP